MFDSYPDVFTISDLIKALRIGKNTAYKLINNKTIKSIQIGGQHRIPKVYVIDYIKTYS